MTGQTYRLPGGQNQRDKMSYTSTSLNILGFKTICHIMGFVTNTNLNIGSLAAAK